MKILMVGVSPERRGGMWTVANNFMQNKEFAKKTQLEYVATSTNGNLLYRILFMITGIFKIKKILKSKKINIIYVHMAEKGSVFRKGYIIRLAKKYHCKSIIQMHAGPIMDWYNSCGIIKQKIIKKIFNSADKFLVLGEYWKNEIIKIVQKEKVDVLYNGIQIPEKNLYNVDNKNIVYMGRINEKKGIFDLIDAVNLIKEKLPRDIKFVLCGEDETGKVKNYISKYKLNSFFILKGWISDNDKILEYKNAKLSILPSYTEGLPMSIIESMSYGIPCISTNITTIPELLPYTNELFEPGDINRLSELILKYIYNPDELKKKSKILYNKAKENYSIDIICSHLFSICCSLIK